MKSHSESETAGKPDKSLPVVSELLILPDGKIMAHSITPLFVNLLSELNPDAPEYRTRREVLDGKNEEDAEKKMSCGCQTPDSGCKAAESRQEQSSSSKLERVSSES